MSWNDYDMEKAIDRYYGDYKRGIFGKKYTIGLFIYPSRIYGTGILFEDGKLDGVSTSYDITYMAIRKIYEEKIDGDMGIIIEYVKDSVVVRNNILKIALMGIEDRAKWIRLLEETKKTLLDKNMEAEVQKKEIEEKERLQLEEDERKASQFYLDCYNFHIDEDTPIYNLYQEKNRVALIYIAKDKSLNFLKIDGYNQEESNGVIPFEKIHYYEKAGNIHYVTDIHGTYSSYGGSVTGGSYSMLATAGGGLLFGMMGMAAGALLTYKAAKTEAVATNFQIDSDAKKIDERSVMLNFYSDLKRQYIDIELPNDCYNFLQTHLAEKRYNIVLELEKKAAVEQASGQIENRETPQISSNAPVEAISAHQGEDSMESFKQKVNKLKMLKESGILTEEEFNIEKAKLLDTI